MASKHRISEYIKLNEKKDKRTKKYKKRNWSLNLQPAEPLPRFHR